MAGNSRKGFHYKMDTFNKMCLTKERFTKAEAKSIARRKNMRAYHCQLCEYWHLTKHRKRSR